jgi:Flp pilus assembly pilin Flp
VLAVYRHSVDWRVVDMGKFLRLSARDENVLALVEYTILMTLIAVLTMSTMKLVGADQWQSFSAAVEGTQGVQPF